MPASRPARKTARSPSARLAFSFALLALSAALPAADDKAPAFFVSPGGNDAWSGTLPAPNAERSDGPLASLPRAQQAVRKLKAASPERRTPITVALRGGTYFLKQPLVFTAADSGSEGAPVIYAAYGNEKPLLSGGERLAGFTARADGRCSVQLPGKWTFSQLYVNGERRWRPRLPKDGYYLIAGEMAATPPNLGKGFDRFKFKDGDIRGDWKNLNDVEVLAFHTWSMSRLRIDSVDDGQHAVAFTGRTISKESWSGLSKGGRYLVENVAEVLDTPGQWRWAGCGATSPASAITTSSRTTISIISARGCSATWAASTLSAHRLARS